MASIKPDLTLSDGHEVTFDLAKITLGEYRALADPKTAQAEEDAILVKVTGLGSIDELVALPIIDYKRLWRAFFAACARPLDDGPNL